MKNQVGDVFWSAEERSIFQGEYWFDLTIKMNVKT